MDWAVSSAWREGGEGDGGDGKGGYLGGYSGLWEFEGVGMKEEVESGKFDIGYKTRLLGLDILST